jgi:hypothetical protein
MFNQSFETDYCFDKDRIEHMSDMKTCPSWPSSRTIMPIPNQLPTMGKGKHENA